MLSLEFCRQIPKVELHVHLEGSVRPETVLKLAKRHEMPLPAETIEGLRDWYTFRDFPHFVEIYVAVSTRIKTASDLELIAQEFVDNQVEHNVLRSEVTYTASTLEKYNGISWADQLAVLKSAVSYAKSKGTSLGFILDIVRGDSEDRALQVAKWVVEGYEAGVVCAQGLAGEEVKGTTQYKEAIAYSGDAGIPFIPHAGETTGAQCIRDCFAIGKPMRIGHGVRCLEDGPLVKELRDKQIPIEVCPTSNVALGVAATLADHPLPRLLDEGLYVTINSDDPPMFSTTISDELYQCSETFGFNEDILWSLELNALNACLLPDAEKAVLRSHLREGFAAAKS